MPSICQVIGSCYGQYCFRKKKESRVRVSRYAQTCFFVWIFQSKLCLCYRSCWTSYGPRPRMKSTEQHGKQCVTSDTYKRIDTRPHPSTRHPSRRHTITPVITLPDQFILQLHASPPAPPIPQHLQASRPQRPKADQMRSGRVAVPERSTLWPCKDIESQTWDAKRMASKRRTQCHINAGPNQAVATHLPPQPPLSPAFHVRTVHSTKVLSIQIQLHY